MNHATIAVIEAAYKRACQRAEMAASALRDHDRLRAEYSHEAAMSASIAQDLKSSLDQMQGDASLEREIFEESVAPLQ